MRKNLSLVEVESDSGDGYVSLPIPDKTVSELVSALVSGKTVSLGGFGRIWVRMHKGHKSNYVKGGRVLSDYPVVRLRVSDEVLGQIRNGMMGSESVSFADGEES